MHNYPAIYKDKRGTEHIIIQSDGSLLYTTIRNIECYGGDFDQLTANKIDTTKFDYELFADGSGDITNFELTITIPIQFYNSLSNQIFSENLKAHIVVGEGTTIKGLAHELNGLTLNTSFGTFKVEKKLEWMEDALIALQKQLPKNIYLKTCLSCKYSNYHPVGNGMFGAMCCFKNYKKEVEQLTSKYDLMDEWSNERIENKSLFFVQETFSCEEHKLLTNNDWVYKSWTKTIEKHEEVTFVENSLFYKELNILLRQHLQAVKENITPEYQTILKQNNLETPLPIQCLFEHAASWYGSRQWRFELDFEDYEWEWSELTFKPHFLNALISLSISKEKVHYIYQLCSSFNEELQPMEAEKIEFQKLNETDFVTHKIDEIQQFLENLPQRFLQEIENINFNDLKFLENEET